MKIKFGAIITDGRNKIGGQVVSRNKAGAYMKNKVTPGNPQSTAQSLKRANVTAISQAWSGLTEYQRSSWRNAVDNFKTTDIFGDLKTPSGFNLFMRLNLNLLNVGVAMILTAPSSTSVDSLTSFSISDYEEGGDVIFAFAPALVPVNHKLVVRASAPLSAGKAFSQSSMRQLTYLEPAAISPHTATIAYDSVFGGAIAGKRGYFAAFLVNTISGVPSALLVDSAIASG